jgi:hypothetical protein
LELLNPLLLAKPIFASMTLTVAAHAEPDLIPGLWQDISPPAVQIDASRNVFCQGMAIDPGSPSTDPKP